MSKNSVFDTLGGCLKGCRGKECASVGVYQYGKRRTTQKAKNAPRKGQPHFGEIKRKNRHLAVLFLNLCCFCGLWPFLTGCHWLSQWLRSLSYGQNKSSLIYWKLRFASPTKIYQGGSKLERAGHKPFRAYQEEMSVPLFLLPAVG